MIQVSMHLDRNSSNKTDRLMLDRKNNDFIDRYQIFQFFKLIIFQKLLNISNCPIH